MKEREPQKTPAYIAALAFEAEFTRKQWLRLRPVTDRRSFAYELRLVTQGQRATLVSLIKALRKTGRRAFTAAFRREITTYYRRPQIATGGAR